jgi:hypothetical protein
LIGNLGRLGRSMAALPDAPEDLSAPAGGPERAVTPRPDESGDVKMGGVPDAKAGAGAGGKKKKKGKK